MRSGFLSLLLRLLLTCSLVLAGGAPALAQAHAGAPPPVADAHAPCHDTAAPAMESMGTQPAPPHHGTHPASPAPGCCGDMAACAAHCAPAGALPVATADWPALAVPTAVLPWPADAGHVPPAPRRLIRPPIGA